MVSGLILSAAMVMTAPVYVELSDVDTHVVIYDTSRPSSVGKYEVAFDITIMDDDLFLARNIYFAEGGTEQGVYLEILDGNGKVSTEVQATASIRSSADYAGTHYHLYEGETETIELNVSLQTPTYGAFKVQLRSIDFATVPFKDAESLLFEVPLGEEGAYDTNYVFLYGSDLPSAVPIPGAIWLLGSVCLGFIAQRRKLQIRSK